MQIIGVAGRKGGSGKTTVAVHLAAELSSSNFRTVLVDCDPQGSATHWAEPGRLPMLVRHMALENETQVATWSKAVRAIPADYVVLDSPPHLNAALGAVVGLCDLAVIPCGPSGLDLIATGETIALVREIRDAKGGDNPRIILVPNRIDSRTGSGRELTAALTDMGEAVAPEIHSRTAFSDAFNIGQWVGEYAPGSPAHREMQNLSSFVLKQIGKQHGKTFRVKRA